MHHITKFLPINGASGRSAVRCRYIAAANVLGGLTKSRRYVKASLGSPAICRIERVFKRGASR